MTHGSVAGSWLGSHAKLSGASAPPSAPASAPPDALGLAKMIPLSDASHEASAVHAPLVAVSLELLGPQAVTTNEMATPESVHTAPFSLTGPISPAPPCDFPRSP
jgi:hypothetical protein